MASKWSLVDAEELEAQLNYWLVRKYDTVQRYRTETGGEGKLYVALNREAAHHSQIETETITGERMVDKENRINQYSYTTEQLFTAFEAFYTWREIIIENIDGEDKLQTLMLDMEIAYSKLNPAEQILLEYKFKNGLTYALIGEQLTISKQAARQKIVRLVEHVRKLIG